MMATVTPHLHRGVDVDKPAAPHCRPARIRFPQIEATLAMWGQCGQASRPTLQTGAHSIPPHRGHIGNVGSMGVTTLQSGADTHP